MKSSEIRPSENSAPTFVIGATGYVGGELLRLIAGHPSLELAGAVSRSRRGTAIGEHFPHLAPVAGTTTFCDLEEALQAFSSHERVAVFSAGPHGESAVLIDQLLSEGEARGTKLELVDLSADFRHADRSTYETTYGLEHGAPQRLSTFHCGLPDLERATPDGPVAHPGCFTTAVTLACAPLQRSGWFEPRYTVSAVTGSTGSGQTPSATTHHPERHGNLKAYRPLHHRHVPEMETLVGRQGGEAPQVLFVPHSGPFARGIHATVHARLRDDAPELDADRLRAFVQEHYAATPFVSVLDRPPRLNEVTGSNDARLGVEVRGRDVVLLSAIDNLLKGAAGGAVQWMNRLWGWPEETGLRLPAWGWS